MMSEKTFMRVELLTFGFDVVEFISEHIYYVERCHYHAKPKNIITEVNLLTPFSRVSCGS